jgi:hypothetical protein
MPFPNVVTTKRKDSLDCVVCGKKFKPYNQVQLTCSKKCSKDMATERTRKWRSSKERKWVAKEIKCAVCRKKFLPTNSVNLTCSIECADAKRNGQIAIWRRDQKDYSRNRTLQKKYGLSTIDYEEMYKKQNGECKICRKSFPRLSVDHNHKNGKIRGLLCIKCNAALGSFQDSPEIMKRAIQYIKKEGEI